MKDNEDKKTIDTEDYLDYTKEEVGKKNFAYIFYNDNNQILLGITNEGDIVGKTRESTTEAAMIFFEELSNYLGTFKQYIIDKTVEDMEQRDGEEAEVT
jgi:hypothetical protein